MILVLRSTSPQYFNCETTTFHRIYTALASSSDEFGEFVPYAVYIYD
jgi:hypothetical protein